MNFLKGLKLGTKSKKDIDLPVEIPLEDEIIDFEKSNPKYTIEKAILAKNLSTDRTLFKSIKNYNELDNYLNGILKYPLINKKEYLILNDPLLTEFFFFFWLGGSICFNELDKTCPNVKNTFDILYTQSKDPKNKIVFNPFFMFLQSSIQRNINLKTEGRRLANEGYILVSLDNEIPGTFLIINPRGDIKKWNLNDHIYFMMSAGKKKTVDLKYYDDLLSTIEDARLESGPLYKSKQKKQKSPTKSKKNVKFSMTSSNRNTMTQNEFNGIGLKEEPEIIAYNFEDIFYSLCDHPLIKKDLSKLFDTVELIDMSWKGIKSLMSIGGPADRAKRVREIEDDLRMRELPSQVNKVNQEVSKYTKRPENIELYVNRIIDRVRKGDDVVIYGNSPKKDMMVVLEVIFGSRNPFKMNNIITPEDFGRKPCVDTFTQDELYQKMKERFPYHKFD
jgi:hypothetical protein